MELIYSKIIHTYTGRKYYEIFQYTLSDFYFAIKPRDSVSRALALGLKNYETYRDCKEKNDGFCNAQSMVIMSIAFQPCNPHKHTTSNAENYQSIKFYFRQNMSIELTVVIITLLINQKYALRTQKKTK